MVFCGWYKTLSIVLQFCIIVLLQYDVFDVAVDEYFQCSIITKSNYISPMSYHYHYMYFTAIKKKPK